MCSNHSRFLLVLLFCSFSVPVFAQSDAQFTINNNSLSSWRLDAYSPAEANVGPLATSNPTLNLVIGKRYEVTDPNFTGHPFQLIAKGASAAQDTVLLSMGAVIGSFESDSNVAWLDSGAGVITFTLTDTLAAAMSNTGLGQTPGYRCANHPSTMRADINIKAAPVCGDATHQPPPGDVDGNCYVDFIDFALMAQNWLDCVSPEPPCGYLPWP